MNLCQRSITLFSILLVFIITTNVSAKVELDQTPCPSTLLDAILRGDFAVVAFLLERGADPNASLGNCYGFEEFEVLNEFPENSLLLHVAARLSAHKTYNESLLIEILGLNLREMIYNLLRSKDVDGSARDAEGKTAQSIYESEQRKIFHLEDLLE